MSLPVVLWSMFAAACLTLGIMHLMVWLTGKRMGAHAAFFLTAVAVAGVAAGELMMMHARSAEEYAVFLRWTHVPLLLLVAGIVWFVRSFLQTGRAWLGWTAVGFRLVSLIINFSIPENLNYLTIRSLDTVGFLGQQITVAGDVVTNPWNRLGELSSLCLLGYVIDASVRLWRTGGREARRRALVIGGSITLSVVFAAGYTVLIHTGVVRSPYFVSFSFAIFVLAMANELSRDASSTLRSAEALEDSRRQAMREAERQRNEMAHLSRVSVLGHLTGALAHELNQPLGIILSNAQAAQRMLSGDAVDVAELREILSDIISEDRRAGEVIKRLRALLKRGETQTVPIDWNVVIDDVLRLLRSDLMSRGVAVQRALADDLSKVLGDSVQMEQVLLNLIVNACDAMSDNSPQERKLWICTAQEAGTVRVSLRDQGCGLPDGDASRIFEPFVTTKTMGLGIGLFICRTIVAVHNGQLWAEANPGTGATFHMEFPAVDSCEV